MSRPVCILPLITLSEEITSTLNYRFTNVGKIPHKEVEGLVLKYLIGEIRDTLDGCLNPLIANFLRTNAQVECYEILELLGSNFKGNPNNVEVIKKLISRMSPFHCALNEIINSVEEDGFDIWTINQIGSCHVVEYVGNYKMMEWEREHIVDGKYVSHKYMGEVSQDEEYEEINECATRCPF